MIDWDSAYRSGPAVEEWERVAELVSDLDQFRNDRDRLQARIVAALALIDEADWTMASVLFQQRMTLALTADPAPAPAPGGDGTVDYECCASGSCEVCKR